MLYDYLRSKNELNQLFESGEIDSDTLKDTIDSIDGELELKAVDLIKYSRELELMAHAVRSEEVRLKERREALLSRADQLKAYVKESMVELGKKKIESDLFTLSLRKSSGKVVINDESLIPECYRRVKMTSSPDKTWIKEALKDGVEVEGAELVKEHTLQIR